jgi:hypothetical protein
VGEPSPAPEVPQVHEAAPEPREENLQARDDTGSKRHGRPYKGDSGWHKARGAGKKQEKPKDCK